MLIVFDCFNIAAIAIAAIAIGAVAIAAVALCYLFVSSNMDASGAPPAASVAASEGPPGAAGGMLCD